ncbi:MAG TPA: acetyl-CoA carboxylase biotin carboxyl carrier protein [Myxococcales bacterium]|nr:acetyl-CoA carboxylase, biotin carboxyl carrier protein [Myxococcales bacterium]MBF93799.1 acetyl-CoA carboxylase, biotin carboxyl carrier protein [Myxococcales bacterium]HBU49255.1 acetyl-CoA carboxylase biotin carboxyl carrier protein [Myxococcales bacterium]|tara:strand:- start:1289 stop:1738 length:450 start_codon:yes stop_codon:yes gene_type:complete
MKMQTLRAILELFEHSSATELEIDNAAMGKVRISRTGSPVAPSTSIPMPVFEATQPPTAKPAKKESVPEEGLIEVTSPFVGTFYESPAPSEPAFAKLGDQVSADQTLCIIEAMKLMNEIPAEVAGEIVEICVKNEQPVEHGQVLFRIRP